eukprot:TRINITY_DN1857_c0_g2_i1.p1 TRINITY_DN1857_c0_g2~~TRINITY_DN1857_c0_g2_i1.p1  ORF type:complete len:257 (-),score=39.36 TRINITY_DN1857_c0_g2_i1:451-1221(-)
MDKNDMIKGKTKKKNVKKACQYCKKSHKKCDNFRPCTNCLRFKKECFYEAPVKKRTKKNKSSNPITHEILPIINKNIILDRIYTLEDLRGIVGPLEYEEKFGCEKEQNLTPNESNSLILKENTNNSNEEDSLRKEIEDLRKEIQMMDQDGIPDGILKMDPIEFINLKRLYMNPNINLPFLPINGIKAGGMFMIGTFEKVKIHFSLIKRLIFPLNNLSSNPIKNRMRLPMANYMQSFGESSIFQSVFPSLQGEFLLI